jgi:hypothetical protein
MKVTDREIAIDLKLGFLLRPFKAKFEENITRHLDQLLAAGGGTKGAAGSATPAAVKPTGKGRGPGRSS